MTKKTPLRIAPTLLAAAVAAAFAGPAAAQEDDVARLILPGSWVDIGLGRLNRDSPRFGLYNGLDEKGNYLLLDFDYNRRDEPTGTWYRARGRNLGLDNREARIEVNRQGNVGVFMEYSEITRKDPNTIFTGLQGIGSDTLRVTTTGLRDVELELQRKIGVIGFEKVFSPGLSATLKLRTEDKQGERIFGRGTPGAMEFLADPQDYQTRQVDAMVAYASERFQVQGGYYGTSFDNSHPALNVLGGASGLATGAGAFTPIGLPPDSDSHQFHVAGGYNFTRGTRVSFKYARSRAKQEDQFILPPAPVVGRDNLGGRVDTELAQVGLTTRVMPGLSLNANLRREDRDDKTPLAQYFTAVTPTSTSNGFNEPRSQTTTFGKVEALYDLRGGWRLAAKYEYDRRERNTSPVRIVTFRDETEEHTVGLEVRRSMSETVTGSLSLQRSDRDGSEYTLTTLNSGAPGSNLVAPLLLADRERDRVRAMIDWSPVERASLQFVAEESRDDYEGSGTYQLGPKEGRARSYSVDASYAIGDAWRINAFYGFDANRAEQASQVGAPTGQLWRAELEMRGKGYGVGLRGKLAGRFDSGIEAQRFDNRSKYQQEAITGAALPQVPDIEFRQTTVKAYVRVPINRASGVRLLYIHDRWHTDDWTWSNFTYSDGTRVLSEPDQRANFFGVAYTLTFR